MRGMGPGRLTPAEAAWECCAETQPRQRAKATSDPSGGRVWPTPAQEGYLPPPNRYTVFY